MNDHYHKPGRTLKVLLDQAGSFYDEALSPASLLEGFLSQAKDSSSSAGMYSRSPSNFSFSSSMASAVGGDSSKYSGSVTSQFGRDGAAAIKRNLYKHIGSKPQVTGRGNNRTGSAAMRSISGLIRITEQSPAVIKPLNQRQLPLKVRLSILKAAANTL